MKKKICFVVSRAGTAWSFLRDHITALSAEYDIFLVGKFTEDDLPILDELQLTGYKSIEIHRNINLIADLNSIFVLKNYLKKNKFYATHSVTPKAGLIAAIASYLSKVPNRIHIFTGQVWHTKHGAFKWMLMTLDKVVAKLNTHILVDGESQRQFLIKNKIIKEKTSFVLGKGSIAGVNVQRFNPDSNTRLRYRNELNMEDKIVFGFLGRLNHDKGITDLFSAYNKLCGELNDVHLLIIGRDEGNMLNTLPNYSNIIEVKNFTYYGATDEPEKILQALNVFCLPSYREGFGVSVLEASCLGIPIICSDTYGLMDAMIDGKTGLRHQVGQSEDLYQKMKFMAENEAARKEMGKNAREFVTMNFSAETISKEWIQFYHKFAS
jgi:glycosyltransferase involved in cell wall biosynthesis